MDGAGVGPVPPPPRPSRSGLASTEPTRAGRTPHESVRVGRAATATPASTFVVSSSQPLLSAGHEATSTEAISPILPYRGRLDTLVDQVPVEVHRPAWPLHEAGNAASTLVAVAPHLPGWAEYHSAFIQRWGPGAAVPLREVLNVLGFPAGYRGSSRRAREVTPLRPG
jgi:hypothetical protein